MVVVAGATCAGGRSHSTCEAGGGGRRVSRVADVDVGTDVSVSDGCICIDGCMQGG
jgi:hypothetical protein